MRRMASPCNIGHAATSGLEDDELRVPFAAEGIGELFAAAPDGGLLYAVPRLRMSSGWITLAVAMAIRWPCKSMVRSAKLLCRPSQFASILSICERRWASITVWALGSMLVCKLQLIEPPRAAAMRTHAESII